MFRFLQSILMVAVLATIATQSDARFLQPDWFEVSNPAVGTNRYAYCHNDPINCTDKNGNIPDNWGVPDHPVAHCSACGPVEADNDHLGPNDTGEHVGRAYVEGLTDRAPMTEEEAREAERQLQKAALTAVEVGVTVSGTGAAVQVGRAVVTQGVKEITKQVGKAKAKAKAIDTAREVAKQKAKGPALPDSAWSKNASKQATPGTRNVQHQKFNQKTGKLEDSSVTYDQHGRQITRTDFTDHGMPNSHTNPHSHNYSYGRGTSYGIEW